MDTKNHHKKKTTIIDFKRRKVMAHPAREEYSKISDALRLLDEAAKEKRAELEDLITTRFEDIKKKIGSIEPEIKEKFSAAQERVSELTEAAKERSKEIARNVDERAHESPWKFAI